MKEILIKNNSSLEVKPSPIHGLGVFTTKEIKKDEIIEICPLIVEDHSMFHHYTMMTGEECTLRHYAFHYHLEKII